MRSFLRTLLSMCLLSSTAWAFAPTKDQCAVNVRWPDASRSVLIVEGLTYRMELDCKDVGYKIHGKHERPMVRNEPGFFRLNGEDGTPVKGPGRVNIHSFGTQMYEIHLRDLKAGDVETKGKDNRSDIELVVYAYAKRVFVNLNVRRYDGRPVPTPFYKGSGIDAQQVIDPVSFLSGDADSSPFCRTQYAGSWPCGLVKTQDKRISAVATALFVGESRVEALRLMHQHAHAKEIAFKLNGGRFDGYQSAKGFYQITTDYAGPRGFEEAWINPNQRYEVEMDVAADFPADIICNVRNTYGVLEASVVTDEHGFPLPIQVQVCKNFGGEKEEGKQEGDAPYGEAYFPICLAKGKPFKGRCYHLFGNWGTHPLKQISSIRFFHHYFHASLGPTETFCYVPFEYPRKDEGRNYILADVRGLTNFAWSGQPQHDHVSLVGALRYKSGGKWVNNLLQHTRIYLTAPNLANFGLEYLSEDGKVQTTLEVFEIPQDDEARSFIAMKMKVLEPVELDGNSAHNLRFLNAGSYIVKTRWPRLAYTDAEGKTTVVDVPAKDTWILEAVPLGATYPFAAGYAHKHGNMCFFINRFKGVLGGKEVDRCGLSCFGGKDWTEMFLTAAGGIRRLAKGDGFEMHCFVMPYGHADLDYKPAERQRTIYGEGLAKIEVTHGKAHPGYPRRITADPRGFARFKLIGGDNWQPILIEGFDTYRGLMLWERRGKWLFHDQQIHGNDWYQTYRDETGKIGFVLVVKVRPGQTHDYFVTVAPQASAITQRNGYVTVHRDTKGGELDFLSPVPFGDLESVRLPDVDAYCCRGKVDRATSR